MIAKYKIDYGIPFHGHIQKHHYLTDDPVAAEQFLSELLERGFKIGEITHEGIALPPHEADGMIRNAAGMLTTRHLCASLGIDTIAARHRFGSPA